jgi:hypothetical protein
MHKKLPFLALVLVLAAVGRPASAETRQFVGSACSYTANPTEPHSKSLHKFVNKSGGSRLVTCPLVTKGNGNVTLATVEYGEPVGNIRLEIRHFAGGSVQGWEPDREVWTKLDGSLRRAEWFTETPPGNIINNDALAFAATVHDDGFIMMYTVNQ